MEKVSLHIVYVNILSVSQNVIHIIMSFHEVDEMDHNLNHTLI